MKIKELVKKFIKEKLLVKSRGRQFRNGRGFFIRNEEMNRHEFIEDKELKYLLDEYILDNFDIETDIPQKNLERAWMYLQSTVPALQISDLIQVTDSQLVFLDGVYDFSKVEFIPFGNRKIFNDTSIMANWSHSYGEPMAFNAFLFDIFDNDQRKVELVYEFIGAMLSTVLTLKKIFIFQGVSQAGKSRLARIICALFDENEVVFLDKLSEINQDDVQRNLNNCRIIYIDETADKKILPSQASTLKTIANGCRRVKILIGTNHALYTGDNGFVEPALLNRFAVLPFEKPMANADPRVSAFEDVFFEKEKDLIIKKSVLCFQKVFARGFFSTEFPINEVTTKELIFEDKNDQLRAFLNQNYELVSEVVPETTTEIIAQEINRVFPGIIRSNATLGKKLLELYGNKLLSQHVSKGIVYNLRRKMDY